jgi:hypothetical protein
MGRMLYRWSSYLEVLLICIYYGWDLLQANPNLQRFDIERLQVIDIPNEDLMVNFLYEVIAHGFRRLFYAFYYGTDQTQAALD